MGPGAELIVANLYFVRGKRFEFSNPIVFWCKGINNCS